MAKILVHESFVVLIVPSRSSADCKRESISAAVGRSDGFMSQHFIINPHILSSSPLAMISSSRGLSGKSPRTTFCATCVGCQISENGACPVKNSSITLPKAKISVLIALRASSLVSASNISGACHLGFPPLCQALECSTALSRITCSDKPKSAMYTLPVLDMKILACNHWLGAFMSIDAVAKRELRRHLTPLRSP